LVSNIDGNNYLARIGLDGNFITAKILSYSFPWSTCIVPNPDNGYLIGPNLLYTDSNFNIIKYQVIYGDQLYSMVLNENQSITGSGISNVQSSTIGVLCVVKIDSSGNYVHSGINETQLQNSDLSIYPNPAINELHIQTTSNEKFGVQLFDITGKQVIKSILFTQTASINIESLSGGIYFVKITDANGLIVKTQKVAVVK
jgi:hypothetical protein